MEPSSSRPLGLLLVVATLGSLTALVYGPSLAVPWYLDDVRNIVENQHLHDLFRAFGELFRDRGLAYLGFALNYHFGGLELTGYHLVNLVLHIGAALLVYRLLRHGCRLSFGWGLLGALLFALHPIQTQAVTYVVQRMTSQAGFFSLLACCLYLTALDAQSRRRLWLTAAWLAATAALLSKESAAVLPLVLWLCERLLRPGRTIRDQWLTLLPFLVLPAWKVGVRLVLPLLGGRELAVLGGLDQLALLQGATPLRYLFTEFSVVWYYLRLIFFPTGQALEYDWPLVANLLTVTNVAAGLAVAALLMFAWRVRQRRPLTALGIAWFFLNLAVESTFIPLDPVVEHRLYLPLLGVVLVLLDVLVSLPHQRLWQGGTLVAVLVLGVLTWQRNGLWSDPLAFYEDNLQRHPRNERIHDELAYHYMAHQDYVAAERTLRAGLAINPDYPRLWNSLGLLQERRGEYDQAIASYRRAIELRPDHYLAYANLGAVFSVKRQWTAALACFRRSLELNEKGNTHFNIGVAYYNQGRLGEACGEFCRAVELCPDDVEALYNYGLTLMRLGRVSEAGGIVQRLERLDQRKATALGAHMGTPPHG